MADRKPVSTGLPIPRSADADTRRFFELVNQRLAHLSAETTAIVRRFGGGGTLGRPDIPVDGRTRAVQFVFPEVPELDVPPGPVGLEALGGIGFVMLSWANPFRFYANHSHTNVYRAEVNQFDQATKITTANEAGFMLYADRNVTGGTTYFYWITWVSTTGTEGPPSASVSARVRQTPAEIYAELTTWLTAGLIEEVLAPPEYDSTNALIVVEEARRIVAALSAILASATDYAETEINNALQLIGDVQTGLNNAESAIVTLQTGLTGKADVSAVTELASRVSANEGNLTALATLITTLRAQIPTLEGIFQRGREPNSFTGATRADAETDRDSRTQGRNTQRKYNQWLADYDANENNYITLEFD